MRKPPSPTGECKHCGINLYGDNKLPGIMPCGVNGCPYETAAEQAKNNAFDILVDAFNPGASNYDVD